MSEVAEAQRICKTTTHQVMIVLGGQLSFIALKYN